MSGAGMGVAGLVTCAEKLRYPFRRWPRGECQTVLFPGCALPAQLPRTMDALEGVCREAGVGVAYDCCGHPLAGFGLPGQAERVARELDARLGRLGCRRLVTACPNCLAHLSGRLSVPCVSVYSLLAELGVGKGVRLGPGVLFHPCPERARRAMEAEMRAGWDLSQVEDLAGAGCCGLAPAIAARGAQATAACTRSVREAAAGRRVYTYCASCLGQFARSGDGGCRHVLSQVLGVDEQADFGRALWNRARRSLGGGASREDVVSCGSETGAYAALRAPRG